MAPVATAVAEAEDSATAGRSSQLIVESTNDQQSDETTHLDIVIDELARDLDNIHDDGGG